MTTGSSGGPLTELSADEAQSRYADVEEAILGSARQLTRVQVAEQSGVDLDHAIGLWRALGFPATHDDSEVAFNESDVEALRMVSWLEQAGALDPKVELTLVRSMGRAFARLAEWEVTELTSGVLEDDAFEDREALQDLIRSLLPVIEDIQNYVWRRHLAHAAGRFFLRPRGEEEGECLLVGFADIVGFTRRSRDLDAEELAGLVEVFEGHSANIVTGHEGRVIKTIGDEILFVADTPEAGARIALELVEAAATEESFPEVRVGLAHGPVLLRVGDVFGPVVNTAARLTSLARPGKVLIDRGLADELKEHEDEFRVRRGRTTSVRGYSRFDTWTLRRPSTKGQHKAGRRHP